MLAGGISQNIEKRIKPMLYRDLGRTGKKVSAIGLGCEHLDRKPYDVVAETIGAALETGINILDVFMPGQEVRENLRKALGARRKDVLIQGHIGSTDVGQQYDISRDMPTVKRYFEELLRAFGGYIDFGMLFFIDSEKDYHGVFETEFIDYALRLKEKGDIGHIGFSSHNPETAAKVVRTGLVESMLFSINLAFDMHPADQNVLSSLDNNFQGSLFQGIDPKRAELYRLCEQQGVGITVMKTLGAGKLLSKEHSPFQMPMTAAQCIHYALSRPAVASTLLGLQSRAQIEEAMSYFAASEQELDYMPILESASKDFRGSCVYCNHCRPCPADIDIAAVNKYLDIARLDTGNIPPSIRSHYQALDHHAEECIACGSCEGRCPFGVSIIQGMQEAARLFG